jgi:spermidine/putrescine transport system permease protein
MTIVAERRPADLSAWARLRGWVRNPWGRPRFLVVFTWAYVLWALVPVIVAVQFSFNETRSRTVFAGFSTRWYFLMLFPLVTPEIVMGVSLLLIFTQLFTFIGTGTTAQILGHVTFSISYVVVIVRGRLFSIGRQYEEAAADLGASPTVALTRVLLPLLTPAIVASAAVVFAISLDDFVISQWLSSGGPTDTVPILIYGATRAGPLPSTNAIATIMMVFTLLSLVLAFVAWRFFTREERRARRSQDLATVLEI